MLDFILFITHTYYYFRASIRVRTKISGTRFSFVFIVVHWTKGLILSFNKIPLHPMWKMFIVKLPN